MKRRVVIATVALALGLLVPTFSQAAPKAGAKCTKKGKIQVYKSYEFTCIKKNGKLVWSKGQLLEQENNTNVEKNPTPQPTSSETAQPAISPSPQPTIIVTPTPSPTVIPTPTPSETKVEYTMANYPWDGPCEKDPWVPAEWADYEKFAWDTWHCARPYRFWEVEKPKELPTNTLTAVSDRNDIQACKLPWRPINSHIGINENRWRFTGDVTIQIVPIQFTDYQSTSNPQSEYGVYLKYLKDMFYKLSDGNTRITYKVPDKFYNLNKSIESYVVPGELEAVNRRFVWKKLNLEQYKSDVFNTVDSFINFSGIKLTLVLVPRSVPNYYIAHSPEFRFDRVPTSEGIVDYNYIWPSFGVGKPDMDWFGAEPFLHLHEVFHAMGLLEDHYGDDAGRSGPNTGTGFWGIMSGMLTDFILWDKWVAGMLVDSQVICAKPNVTSTNWLTPAGYFGKYEKFLIVPLSSSKAIAVESQRRAGINFKLTAESEGALVYLIDTEDRRHNAGINVLRPLNRTTSIYETKFIMSDAPLKLGESLIVEGHKITVVESGSFGDVVRVEKT